VSYRLVNELGDPMTKPQLVNPFFANRLQVVELARRRYFEEGIPPSGVISEAVFQSWARCQRLHDGPARKVEFQPVTTSRTQLALQRNRLLHEAWLAEATDLLVLLGTSSCAAMLTDGSGVLIGATCAGRPHENLMPVATRLGVDLSEEAVGTTAPGVVVRTGQPVCVIGSEHFFNDVRQMHCAAAPIRDTRGLVAGVLDISSESIAFGFDAASVVGHLACAIENRLLVAQASDQLVLRLQMTPPLLDSSAVGLIGIALDGRIAWMNGIASRLLGVPALDRTQELPSAEAVLGNTFGRLASLPQKGVTVLSLPNGLTVWVRSDWRIKESRHDAAEVPVQDSNEVADSLAAQRKQSKLSADGAIPHSLSDPDRPILEAVLLAPPREAGAETDLMNQGADSGRWCMTPQDLKANHQDLVQKTLRECDGNLSQAARLLGVSRGWIYRRMQDHIREGGAESDVPAGMSTDPARVTNH
jgi:transcriptional regulator of acetoin/glycerol metabolism